MSVQCQCSVVGLNVCGGRCWFPKTVKATLGDPEREFECSGFAAELVSQDNLLLPKLLKKIFKLGYDETFLCVKYLKTTFCNDQLILYEHL